MNKYKQLIDTTHIEVGQEYTTLSRLLESVGFPMYKNQLDQWKQERVLQESLATKGLTYKRVSDKSFKVIIVTM